MSDDFDDLAEPVPARRHAGAVATAGPPGAAEVAARLFGAGSRAFQARLLERLLRPVGPLGLVAVAAGAFAGFLQRSTQRGFGVSLDEVAAFSQEQVLELARFVEQCSPETFQQMGALLADHPAGAAGIGTTLLVLAHRAWTTRRETPGFKDDEAPSG